MRSNGIRSEIAQNVFSEPTKEPPWHGYVSADFFLSGLSAGMFMFAGFGYLIAPEIYRDPSRIGYLVAFPLVLVDLACLVADLGDPMRFHHMLRVFKARSPMSTGTWILTVYAFLAFIAFVFALVEFSAADTWRAVLGAIGILPALYVTAYKGVMLSSTAQPGWKDARWLGAEFALSSGGMGAAGLMLIALALADSEATAGYRLALVIFLVIGLLAKLFLAPRLDRRAELRRQMPTGAYAFVLVVGLIAPLALTIAARSGAALIAAGILTLAGELLFRHHLIALPGKLGRQGEPGFA